MIEKTFCGPRLIESQLSTSDSPPHKRMKTPLDMTYGVFEDSISTRVSNGTGYAGSGDEDVS